MGILDKLFGKPEPYKPEVDLEKLVTEEMVGDAVHPPAKMYVKKIPLRNEGDANLIIEEVKKGNIIFVDIEPLIKQQKRLKEIVLKIKGVVENLDGDIVLVQDKNFLIVTPAQVKIVKSKK